MNLNELTQLPWEVNKAGTVARLHRGLLKPSDYGYGAKLVAVSKMMDVGLISGDFHGYPVGFEPWVVVAWDHGSSMDFCAVYQRAFAGEEGEPDFCLRRSCWDEEMDRKQFRSAGDKLAYMLSDGQLKVEAVFGLLAEHPHLEELAHELETILLSGYSTQRCQRDAEQRSNLYLKVMSKTLPYSWNLTYSMGVLKSEKLEHWVDRWLAYAQRLDFQSGFIPVHGTCVSYPPTLLDRLGSFQA